MPGVSSEPTLAGAVVGAKVAPVLTAVTKGRIDEALKLAKPLAEEAGGRETPAALVARECSQHAALAFHSGSESRVRGVQLAAGGSTFELPGRVRVPPRQLAQSFWLREVSDQYHRATALSRLCRASTALRGCESEEQFQRLASGDAGPPSSGDGEQHGEADAVACARDFQILGKLAVVQLQTSRVFCVVHAYVNREFRADPRNIAKYPMLFTLFMKGGRHLTAMLGDGDPRGPLDDVALRGELAGLRRWAEQRQAAIGEHMQIISEVVSEAATNFYPDLDEKLGLLEVASTFYEAECPLAERRRALTVFRDTAARLQKR